MEQQIRDLFSDPVEPTGKQHCAILNYLREGGSLTTLEALQKFGVMALAQRISDLKRMGWPIKSTFIKTDTGKHVSKYTYEGGPDVRRAEIRLS